MVGYTKCSDKLKTFFEKNRTFILNNKNGKTYGYTKGEPTATQAGQKRCDYIVSYDFNEAKQMFYLLVELKGSDNDHALAQIEDTLSFLKKIDHDFLSKTINCFIITGESPKENSKTQIAKAKLSKSYRVSITIRTNKYSYTI